MSEEQVVLPQQVEPCIQHQHELAVERPAPSTEQEQVADGLFTKEQEKALASLMMVQTGLGLMAHLAREAFPPEEEEEEKPRKRQQEKEDDPTD